MRTRIPSALQIPPAIVLLCALILTAAPPARAQISNALQPADYQKLRSVGQAEISPDGKLVAYTIVRYDRPGRPWGQLWVMDLATKKSIRMGAENEGSGGAVWSPDGRWIAYFGAAEGKNGLVIAHPDGTGATFLAEVSGTNAPLPSTGASVTWSPDSKQIAFVSATPGPETADATGDPIVITRYMYKPDAAEGLTHFNDNRRLHIFIVDIATKQIRQLTKGDAYEHSIDWSPRGDEIVFISDPSPNADQFFNYDVFAIKVSDGSIRRLTATENAEYHPKWSPDGNMIAFLATKRGLTDRETTMEDTHVWVMNADGSGRHEFADADFRQGPPQWSPDGRFVYFTAQSRGSVFLYRQPVIPNQQVTSGKTELVFAVRGSFGAFSLSKSGTMAYTYTSPGDMAELYLMSTINPLASVTTVLDSYNASEKITNLNADILGNKQIADVIPFTFISNDNKYEVEAFLVKPLGMTATSKHPLIVNIHGGPHGQNGPAFNFKDQVYAARGWATLHVNYRGSTGYGQAFADAVFGDQDGNEAQDVLYGVSAALRRYLWLDRERMGVEGVSYGGQLSDWLITQTRMFRAAIPIAGISNLISYNYMTYYNQYEQMEFGQLPHQGDFMNLLWERSALKHVAAAATPTMLMHGENDPDVPIAEAEQFYVALKDVGVETIMVRYPREGHGIRESAHTVDSIIRCIAWYEKHFPKTDPAIPSAAVP
ncbi:MAG TPA: S9 family peptidase [Candidatus Acidoferrales bacterium]|nr:S9 family peptidase [Candidatus Acidoferrales bacterium]